MDKPFTLVNFNFRNFQTNFTDLDFMVQMTFENRFLNIIESYTIRINTHIR